MPKHRTYGRHHPMWGRLVKKIISPGQPGAERAALDAAIALAIPRDDLHAPDPSPEVEAASGGDRIEAIDEQPEASVRRNLEEADGVLLFLCTTGSAHADDVAYLAAESGTPVFTIDIDAMPEGPGVVSGQFKSWLLERDVHELYVSGNLESESAGIEERVRSFLTLSLSEPETVDGAAEKLLWELPGETLHLLLSAEGGALTRLLWSLKMYVRNTHGLYHRSCPLTHATGRAPEPVSTEIVNRARERLRSGASAQSQRARRNS
jgi:Circularly permutated YpsA SLOG family